MPHQRVAPETRPSFHRLTEETQHQLAITEKYLAQPYKLYPHLLTLLAQQLDKVRQSAAESELIARLKKTGRILGADPDQAPIIRHQRDEAKQKYLKSLEEGSALKALSEIIASQEASNAYFQGYNGGANKLTPPIEGQEIYPFPLVVTEISTINAIDPQLANRFLIEIGIISSTQSIAARRQAFINSGFGPFSSEYGYFLLLLLEINAKRLMIGPVIDQLKIHGHPRSKTIFPQDRSAEFNQKKEILARILLGNSQSPRPVTKLGTEFFRGYLDLVYESLSKTQFGFPNDDEQDTRAKIIRTLAFLRTSERKHQSIGDLYASILIPLKNGDYDSAIQEIKRLEYTNPKLFPFLPFPLTSEEQQFFLLEELDRLHPKQPDKSPQRPPSKTDKTDPSLRPQVESMFGHIFFLEDGFGTTTYKALHFCKTPGYLIVAITDDDGHPSYAKFSYCGFLAKIKPLTCQPSSNPLS